MTIDATLALLRAILADVPVAIASGADLIRLINDIYARLAQPGTKDVSREEIRALMDEITATSVMIQQIDAST